MCKVIDGKRKCVCQPGWKGNNCDQESCDDVYICGKHGIN